jgi:hypothetical protein
MLGTFLGVKHQPGVVEVRAKLDDAVHCTLQFRDLGVGNRDGVASRNAFCAEASENAGDGTSFHWQRVGRNL